MKKDENDSPSFKLLLKLSQIKPNYEAIIRSGQLKVTEHGIQLGMLYIQSFNFQYNKIRVLV